MNLLGKRERERGGEERQKGKKEGRMENKIINAQSFKSGNTAQFRRNFTSNIRIKEITAKKRVKIG